MRTVKKNARAKDVEVAPGFIVKRPFPVGHSMDEFDPFLLLDHFGPKDVPADTQELVPPHPHYGFQPVSLIFDGQVGHKDTMGNDTLITSGGAQWLTAGKGLMHSELFGVDSKEKPRLHGVQLWVNLPTAHKRIEPDYKPISRDEVAEVEKNGVRIRVFAGEVFETKGPASAFSELLIAHAIFEEDGSIELPVDRTWNAQVYHLKGETQHGSQFELTQFNKDGESISLDAKAGTELLLLFGEPINEPIVTYGPFVANSSEEIWEAMQSFQQGKMGDLKE